jgi:demethylmenaquinone methyltransferase/2-methoxy-6-polyprenyl-1,4-benzoquinol methylase
MPIFDHFDFLAPIYDHAIPFAGMQEWLQHTNLPAKGSLLDIGGGTGRVAAALQGHIDHIVVVDLSHGMLSQAHKKNLDALQCYSEKLCFPDGTFDRIIMADAFHHIIDGKTTVSEMWRVLKPGGKIIIHEPDIRVPVVWFVAIAEKLAFMRSHFVSPPSIAKIFEGFPGSSVNITRNGYTAWISVRKKI